MKKMSGKDWRAFKAFIKTLDRFGLEASVDFGGVTARRIWKMWG